MLHETIFRLGISRPGVGDWRRIRLLEKIAIFYNGEEQRRLAEESKKMLDESGRFQDPMVTEILPLGPFYRAEEYHQDYYRKQAARYQIYERLSGREGFIEEYWKGTE